MLKSITYNGSTYTYEYDGFGRLTKETSGNTVIGAYSYDGQNNVQDGTLTYDSNGQLIRVDGLGIMYDALGNPTIYKGVYLTWGQGRKLLGGQTTDGKTYTYSYDGNGMRYRKKIGNSVTDYYYSGTQLLMESRGGQRIYYVYGQTGIEAMILSGSNANNVFYFDKNTLGDIVAIRNNQGVIVAEYEYDAWGRIIYQSGEMADINPFRYRGYYYDTETGFYYLQTRYYDPEAMRFINADNYELVSKLAQSYELNLYAYCANNPVMFTDETGEFIGSLFVAALIGALLGGATGVIGAAFRGENLLGGFLSGALTGFVLGAATMIGGVAMLAIGGKSIAGFSLLAQMGKGAVLATTMGVTAISSFCAGVGSYAIQARFNNKKFKWSEAFGQGVTTALNGLINFSLGMSMGAGGAYNFLLKNSSHMSFKDKLISGIGRGIISNSLRLLQYPWSYLL